MDKLTPEEEYNKILGEASQRIQGLQNQIDNPTANKGPAPSLRPQGVTPVDYTTRTNNKDAIQQQIYDTKAETIAKTDTIISGMPKHVQPEMKQRVMDTLYPAKGSDSKHYEQRSLNDSQERMMQQKADVGRERQQQEQPKSQGKDKDDAGNNQSRFSQGLNYSKHQQTSNNETKQPVQEKDNPTGKEEGQNKGDTWSMSSRFTQSLNYTGHEKGSTDTGNKSPNQDKDATPSKNTAPEPEKE